MILKYYSKETNASVDMRLRIDTWMSAHEQMVSDEIWV